MDSKHFLEKINVQSSCPQSLWRRRSTDAVLCVPSRAGPQLLVSGYQALARGPKAFRKGNVAIKNGFRVEPPEIAPVIFGTAAIRTRNVFQPSST